MMCAPGLYNTVRADCLQLPPSRNVNLILPEPLAPPPPISPCSQSICSECSLPAGRKCALCSACGGAFHPQCLQPPLQHRPPGSLPAALHGKNTWVCFHCECAIPVRVEDGQDDPVKMAAGEWASAVFGRVPFQKRLREFWDKEHARAAAENAELLERRRQREEEARKKEEERKKAEKVRRCERVR